MTGKGRHRDDEATLGLSIAFLVGVVVVLRHPGRGWQDRLAGTTVVLR